MSIGRDTFVTPDKYLGSISKFMSVCRDTCYFMSRDKYLRSISKLMSIGRDTFVSPDAETNTLEAYPKL